MIGLICRSVICGYKNNCMIRWREEVVREGAGNTVDDGGEAVTRVQNPMVLTPFALVDRLHILPQPLSSELNLTSNQI